MRDKFRKDKDVYFYFFRKVKWELEMWGGSFWRFSWFCLFLDLRCCVDLFFKKIRNENYEFVMCFFLCTFLISIIVRS